MTDAEVICTWMEPKPEMPPASQNLFDRAFLGEWLNPWWMLTNTGYEAGDQPVIMPRGLDLDALWEVEQQMTNEQRTAYVDTIAPHPTMSRTPAMWAILHATAEQKIKALAQVLRPIVENSSLANQKPVEQKPATLHDKPVPENS